ncbi:MAG: zinc-dependent metalloprotease [Cellulomonadaceae bacterium]|jgi:putative hydrolase|nr:zinc-dependent metalloprotease [Cellulomonadaceae bacterium]
MSSENVTPTSDDDRDRQVRDLMKQLFGDRADEMMERLREQGMDPAAMVTAPGGRLPSPWELQSALAQVRAMFAASGDDPVNSQVARDMARQVSVSKGDPVVNAAQAKQVRDALSVAELWLDAATSFPPSGGGTHAWSRAEWVEATLETWHTLAAPVAASVANGLATVMGGGAGEDRDGEDDGPFASDHPDVSVGVLDEAGPGLKNLGLDGLSPSEVIRKVGSSAFGIQIGQAAGTLSQEVFGATDVGLPLLPGSGTALLPTNVTEFAAGLDAPLEEVFLFLAMREAAHARLFAHVPWVRSHLLSLVDRYARGIRIDLNALESQMRDIDPSDPSGIHKAMSSGGIFGVQPTEEQHATLLQLETALALVEGWVDEVVAQAALPHLPFAVSLREMIRRRRAAGGPAEQTFASLVGLELRPRRSRDAATLMSHVYVAGGVEGRDAVWSHPDLLPDAGDLDDPAGYLARREAQSMASADVDAALAAILAEADGEDPGSEAGTG